MDFIRKVKDKLEERPECQDKVILIFDLIFGRHHIIWPLFRSGSDENLSLLSRYIYLSI